MVNHPDNLLYVPELKEEEIVKHLVTPDKAYAKNEKAQLFEVLEILFGALNEADDVQKYLKTHALPEFENATAKGYAQSKTMFEYEDIDVEQIKKHPTISWLFEPITS
mmetsp:Transcript_18653/g.21430  ORF Transcript_18653/g.21430 Transcript_18653/m.21430 type:complete len:108 (-) Transcript_18653:3-326(-)